jgi:protein-disulfide isomerase
MKPLVLLAISLSCILTAQPKPPAAAKPKPAAPPAPAPGYLNKETMGAWVRHFRLYPPQVKLDVSDATPSDVPGLLALTVRASAGAAAEQLHYYVTRDGKKIIDGRAFDASENPFKREIDKLKTDSAPGLGTPGAPVVIVVFSDFQCGYCKKEAEALRAELVKTFPTQVRLYFKDYPLETIHPWAKTAAIAGRCVFRQDANKFWDYHDAVFADQEKITAENVRSTVKEIAKAKGLDEPSLDACLADKSAEAEIAKSVAEAQELGVQSTPTLFVNGRSIPGSVPWQNLKQIIDLEIGYQAVAHNAGEQCCSLPVPSLLNLPKNPVLPK